MPDSTILIVDDSPDSLAILSDLLRPDYQVRVANSGNRALQLTGIDPAPDLILLDVMMPGLDGYAVLEQLKADPLTRDIPVIFITALNLEQDQFRGFKLGAVDYITKPIMPLVVQARIRTHLELKHARDRLSSQNTWLESEVNRRMSENVLIQKISVRALAHLAETRDPETGNHILRTQSYVNALALRLKDHPNFTSVIDDAYTELITQSAPLHDIGKVGIPDHVLLKPGALSADEWTIMKTHAELGAKAIELAEFDVDKKVEFLTLAKEIAHWHHERWDGKGYPDGLTANDIPVSARLMSVADVFDALINKRVYKPAMSFEKAREIIADGRGSQFDPDVVDAFLDGFENFKAIAQRYRETDSA